jgi:hypothetical protein
MPVVNHNLKYTFFKPIILTANEKSKERHCNHLKHKRSFYFFVKTVIIFLRAEHLLRKFTENDAFRPKQVPVVFTQLNHFVIYIPIVISSFNSLSTYVISASFLRIYFILSWLLVRID